MIKKLFPGFVLIFLIAGCADHKENKPGSTTITKWQNGKKGAVSITYDDGSHNQFKVALPIMQRLGLPATFFIITGPIAGSQYQGKFVGRPVKEIIRESASVPTNKNNFFERASASRYLGYKGALAYYDSCDNLYESGKKEAAYKVIDGLYEKVRNGALSPGKDTSMEIAQEKGLTWEEVKKYAREGYEFASHTVTHAHLAILDTANIFYELEKSKEDIRDHLGKEYTFSAEVPFGIEDPRVMKYAFQVYPALRNLMLEPYMKEINRGHKDQPGSSNKQYVQWQRGPLSETPLSLMKSWIDTTLAHNNIWLVLVIHGVDDIGWQPLTHQTLNTYFHYIKDYKDSLWIAPFGTVTRYMREKMNAKLNVQPQIDEGKITIRLNHSLNTSFYDLPLTLKTYLPSGWDKVAVKQGGKNLPVNYGKDENGNYILYKALPGKEVVNISQNS